MKIIKRKVDGVVVFAGRSLELLATGATNGDWTDPSITTANAVIAEVDELPTDWIGGAYKHTTAGGFEVANASLIPDPMPAMRAEAVASIDRDVDALYAAVVGNRAEEYTEAERQAQTFADGGYAGTAPPMVASWAAAKGWTGQRAADDILQQAAQWRTAQEQIRAERLMRKEQARSAATVAELQAVSAQWSGFVAAVRQQLGV